MSNATQTPEDPLPSGGPPPYACSVYDPETSSVKPAGHVPFWPNRVVARIAKGDWDIPRDRVFDKLNDLSDFPATLGTDHNVSKICGHDREQPPYQSFLYAFILDFDARHSDELSRYFLSNGRSQVKTVNLDGNTELHCMLMIDPANAFVVIDKGVNQKPDVQEVPGPVDAIEVGSAV